MKELKFKINTEKGQISFITQKIEGFLNCIIINSPKVQISISSENGYNIFSRESIEGDLCISPRNWTDFPEYDITDKFGNDKFLLNERLKIIIQGMPNQEIKMIIRYEEIYNKPINIFKD